MREYYATSQQVQCFAEVPSEEFELKANSLGAHIETHFEDSPLAHSELIR